MRALFGARRIAIESNALILAEYSALLSESVATLRPDDIGRKNLIELAEFIKMFDPGRPDAELEFVFPDLFNQHVNRAAALAMYRRFASEARSVFATYPGAWVDLVVKIRLRDLESIRSDPANVNLDALASSSNYGGISMNRVLQLACFEYHKNRNDLNAALNYLRTHFHSNFRTEARLPHSSHS